MTDMALELRDVRRTFRQAEQKLDVLRGVDMSLRAGEVVALIGPSGAGKSTLLQLAGLLEKPDAGEVLIEGMPTARLDDSGRTRLRRHSLGFVYQFHHLLPEFTALENVVLPQRIAGQGRGTATARAPNGVNVACAVAKEGVEKLLHGAIRADGGWAALAGAEARDEIVSRSCSEAARQICTLGRNGGKA